MDATPAGPPLDPDGYDGRPPLEIAAEIEAAMVDHCLRDAPAEACGLLAGPATPRVTSIYPLRNRLSSATRYDAHPRDLIDAVMTMRARGERMLAIYHSHPASPPIPSRVDLARNYYGPLPRIIVGLAGERPEVRCWRLDTDGFEERAIVRPGGGVAPPGPPV